MSLKPKKVDFEDSWRKLSETVKGVITCGSVKRSVWNDRFSDVYALCVAYPEPLGDQLYNETKTFLEQHVSQLHKEVGGCGEENVLTTYHRHWQEYSRGSSYLNSLYGYVNTQYIKNKKFTDAEIMYGGFALSKDEGILEIGELCLDIWKRLMITPLKDILLKLLLSEIMKDRKNQPVNQSIIHGVITSLVNVEEYKVKCPLKLYEDLFEQPFLEETGSYYRNEAKKLLDKCSISEYLEKAIQKLDEENFRSRKFLNGSSFSKVTKVCQERMVADNLSFLHSECQNMVQKEIQKDLSNMYILLKPIHGGIGVLIDKQEEHIKQLGLEAVSGLKGENIPQQFVENMLEVYYKYKELIQTVYFGDQLFRGALDKACIAVVNHHKHMSRTTCRSPELLAKFCDILLKKSSKGMSESEVDDKLSNSIIVFKYLDDKDIYQRFYQRMLAKRLIWRLSISMDAEEAMINKLKQACGYEFTNKLHRMYTDIKISGDLQSDFGNFIKEKELDVGINFSMSVLQAGAWPIGQSNLPTFSLPQELEKSVNVFEMFYNKKFNGRKLTWMHSFCSGELKFNYLKKPYFVTVGTYQMAILLAFNSLPDICTFKEIAEYTQLSFDELVKQMQTLVDTKLLLTEDSKPCAGNSTFELNTTYTNKRTKFKITAAIQKDTHQDVEQTHSAIDEDRKLYVQAAIVRIMKARKSLRHNLLIQEVISQSRARFAPPINMIKKCIEALIDKQYIERTPKSTDEYSYIA